MSDRSMIKRAGVLGLALGGVLLGHAITYAGLAPGAVAREMLLAATGHGYLGVANRLGLLAVIVVLGATVLSRVTGRHAGQLTQPELAVRLITFQVCAFAALEIAERLNAGAPLSGLATVVPIGLVIQVAIAVGLAALVRWLLDATDRIVALIAAPITAPPAAIAAPILAVAGHRPVWASAPLGGRAPPRSR